MHLHSSFPKKNSIHLRFSIAVLLNFVVAIAQVIYAYHAHSVSLLSDGLHNIGDVVGLFIAWLAQIVANSTRHASRYTYGYQQSTLLAAFINALLLLLSVGIIVYETIFKLTHVDTMNEVQVLFIAALGVLVNGLTALLFIKEKDNDINIKAAFLHLMLDALTSLGVVISSLVIYYGGYQWIDSIMALLIGAVIWVSGWKLLRRSLDLLLGAVPPNINLDAVKQYLMSLPNVVDIEHLHIWALGTEKVALTAHLVMQDSDKSIDYAAIQSEITQQFQISHVTLQPVRLLPESL
jgi:cobalt-zinc-cadmium efflux system protein